MTGPRQLDHPLRRSGPSRNLRARRGHLFDSHPLGGTCAAPGDQGTPGLAAPTWTQHQWWSTDSDRGSPPLMTPVMARSQVACYVNARLASRPQQHCSDRTGVPEADPTRHRGRRGDDGPPAPKYARRGVITQRGTFSSRQAESGRPRCKRAGENGGIRDQNLPRHPFLQRTQRF